MMIAKRGSAEDEEKAPNLSSAAEDVNQEEDFQSWWTQRQAEEAGGDEDHQAGEQGITLGRIRDGVVGKATLDGCIGHLLVQSFVWTRANQPQSMTAYGNNRKRPRSISTRLQLRYLIRELV